MQSGILSGKSNFHKIIIILNLGKYENSNPGPFNSIQSHLYKDVKLIPGLKPLTPQEVFIDLVSSKSGSKLLSDIGKLDFGGDY